MRIRSGFSFRSAYGFLPDVFARIETPYAPITDRASTYGFNSWRKLCEKGGKKPIYGIELAITDSPNAKVLNLNHVTLIATTSLAPINRAFELACSQYHYEPLLTYSDLNKLDESVAVILGRRIDPSRLNPDRQWYYAKGPSTIPFMDNNAQKFGWLPIASSDNVYPAPEDRHAYQLLLGRQASTQTWPQHIMSDSELSLYAPQEAFDNRDALADRCVAEMNHPRLVSLKNQYNVEDWCREGAMKLGVDLADPVYSARFAREMEVIKQLDFEDYFLIIADLVRYARANMFVGPARGSSCGSLVCYLMGITTVDPIIHDLLFERFLDPGRTDLPDIDIDFSDQNRNKVFEYLADRYGRDHVARLGTVSFLRERAIVKEISGALKIPAFKFEASVANVENNEGNTSLSLVLKNTQDGVKLLSEHPELSVLERLEGHPRHSSTHAAGVVVTDKPISEYVAINARTNTAEIDKHDAEDLGMLKIDALGLKQLSVFEDCLAMLGKPNDWLISQPLDDPAAFKVLNDKLFSGVFQYNGRALQQVSSSFEIVEFEDMVATTALARPGPMGAGGTDKWIRVRRGESPVVIEHEAFRPILEKTKGIVLYQEQVMQAGREIGDMSWSRVTKLRKAVQYFGGAKGMEEFRDEFMSGAANKNIPEDVARRFWDDLLTYGSYAFNRCLHPDQEIWVATTGGGGRGSSRKPLRKAMKIKDLYDLFTANPHPGMVSAKKFGPVLWSIDENGVAVKQRAKAIIKNPIKDIYEYSFDDGTKVLCTEDHRFLINGEWKNIGSSSIGDEFSSLKPKEVEEVNKGAGKGHAKGKQWKIKGGDRTGQRNVSWTNGWSKYYKEFKEKNLKAGTVCEDCGNIHPRMEAHHLDFNHGKDRPEDLAWLCCGCHKKRHYKAGRTAKDGKGLKVATKKLVSKKFLETIETYDIEMPTHHNFALANGIITHNSHAVAYSEISYWCCYLKAHHPLEYAAAMLNHEKEPSRQRLMLKEIAAEGISYKPVDPESSGMKWQSAGGNLVGPLTLVKGLGERTAREYLRARERGDQPPKRALKLLSEPSTPLDTLAPIEAAIHKNHPDLTKINIFSTPTKVEDLGTQKLNGVLLMLRLVQAKPRKDEKSGGTKMTALMEDDTGEIKAFFNNRNYETYGKKMLDAGRVGQTLWAVKGSMPDGGGIIFVDMVRFLGEFK